jgi:hypothetical protein
MVPSISSQSVLRALLSCQALFSGLSYAQTVTGQLGNAIRNTRNPKGAAYIAEISTGTIKGSVVAINSDRQGTGFAVNLEGLPLEGGPFSKFSLGNPPARSLTKCTVYHIHVAPVPSDGNCTATLAHLDPFIRGEATPCQSNRPDTCQVGDLAGKHGKINGTSISARCVKRTRPLSMSRFPSSF